MQRRDLSLRDGCGSEEAREGQIEMFTPRSANCDVTGDTTSRAYQPQNLVLWKFLSLSADPLDTVYLAYLDLVCLIGERTLSALFRREF
jgi:hypothetical protein